MTRYVGELRWRFVGDAQLAQSFIPHARKVVGMLHETSPGIPTNRIVREVSEGVTVTVWHWMSQITAEIDVRVLEAKRAEDGQNAVWIPKGFVVYPASDASLQGWGLPIIPVDDPEVGPYAPDNTSPGLDTARWTQGGALGQVLLSRVPNAGYPQTRAGKKLAAAPLLYHHEFGPKITRFLVPPPEAQYSAYRLELFTFDGDPRHLECFELTNELRTEVGRTPLSLPTKWRFNPGQASSDMMAETRVLGHFSDRFWPTWMKTVDRAFRDGALQTSYGFPDGGNGNYWEVATASHHDDEEVIGVDPEGNNIYHLPTGGPPISAQNAVDNWRNSSGHYAALTRTALDADTGRIGATFIGFTGNSAAQHLVRLDQWIHCGNRRWRSSHPEIPMLTWFGFPTLNLGWETMPVNVNHGVVPPLPQPPPPLFSYVYDFAFRSAYAVGGDIGAVPSITTGWDGVFHSPSVNEDLRSTDMQRFVFSRGRAIAMVPKNGLVWAAAIQKREVDDEPPVYRLVVISHHITDQAQSSNQAVLKTVGPTVMARVWWVDIPSFDALFAARPERMIYGVFGEEDEGWPWDRVNSPYSWRGGDKVDVGTSDGGVTRDLLKYASQWVFNRAGTAAICARDKGTLADYEQRIRPTYGTQHVTTRGLAPVALELTFTPSMTPVLNVFAPPACATQRVNACEWVPAAQGANYFVGNLLAAGYDEADNRKFAFLFTVTYAPFMYTPEVSPNFGLVGFSTDYDWLPTCALQAPDLILTHSATRSPVGSALHDATNALSVFPQVLDVEDEVVVVSSRRPRAMEYLYGTDPDYGDIYNITGNPDTPWCWKTALDTYTVQVRAWRKGVYLGERSYPHNDMTLPNNDFSLFQYNVDAFGTSVQGIINTVWSINPLAIATYARSGEDWILNYTVIPQPYAADVDMSVDLAPLGVDPAVEECLPHIYRWRGIGAVMENASRGCRGGYSYSSFATHDELVEMTQTPGANARFLYVRAV